MRRTLKVLGLIGVTAAAATATVKRVVCSGDAAQTLAKPPFTLSQELRQALDRFEDRFGT
jgi:hypothetical protein